MRGFADVEFFGIDFGVKEASICSDCGSEYLSQEVIEEVEAEVKRRGLFLGKLDQARSRGYWYRVQ